MPKRTITIKEFVRDIRAGQTDEQLMAKYQLDIWGLQNAFKKMLEIKVINPEHLEGRESGLRPDTLSMDRREVTRRYVLFSFPVYDAENLQEEGMVHDISEKGLHVVGIRVAVGDEKSLLIRADEFADIFPFVFDAQCRWITPRAPDGEFHAGFAISNISERSLEELQKLIHLLSFE